MLPGPPGPGKVACRSGRRRRRGPRLDVRPAARVLDVRVRVALEDLDDLEAGRLEGGRHIVWAEEVEVDRDPMRPPLVQVDRLVADVEGQEQHSTRAKDPLQLAEDGGDLGP